MAIQSTIKITCDGCQEELNSLAVHERGQYAKVQYCAACAIRMDDFEELIQKRVAADAEKFEEWLSGHRSRFKKEHGFKRLPDERTED